MSLLGECKQDDMFDNGWEENAFQSIKREQHLADKSMENKCSLPSDGQKLEYHSKKDSSCRDFKRAVSSSALETSHSKIKRKQTPPRSKSMNLLSFTDLNDMLNTSWSDEQFKMLEALHAKIASNANSSQPGEPRKLKIRVKAPKGSDPGMMAAAMARAAAKAREDNTIARNRTPVRSRSRRIERRSSGRKNEDSFGSKTSSRSSSSSGRRTPSRNLSRSRRESLVDNKARETSVSRGRDQVEHSHEKGRRADISRRPQPILLGGATLDHLRDHANMDRLKSFKPETQSSQNVERNPSRNRSRTKSRQNSQVDSQREAARKKSSRPRDGRDDCKETKPEEGRSNSRRRVENSSAKDERKNSSRARSRLEHRSSSRTKLHQGHGGSDKKSKRHESRSRDQNRHLERTKKETFFPKETRTESRTKARVSNEKRRYSTSRGRLERNSCKEGYLNDSVPSILLLVDKEVDKVLDSVPSMNDLPKTPVQSRSKSLHYAWGDDETWMSQSPSLSLSSSYHGPTKATPSSVANIRNAHHVHPGLKVAQFSLLSNTTISDNKTNNKTTNSKQSKFVMRPLSLPRLARNA